MAETVEDGEMIATDEEFARPFASWLTEQQAGRTHSELSEAFHDLLAAVRDTGKPGTLTLTVKVKPLSKGDGNTVVIGDTVKLKAPAADRAESVFFIDAHGNPSRHDPRQMSLPLKRVAAPAAPAEPKQAQR